MIRLIAGISLDRAIGVYESKKGKLPWGRREAEGDLALFRALTDGDVVIMGRKTFESIGSKPLANRDSLVVSSKSTVSVRFKGIEKLVEVPSIPSVRESIEFAQKHYGEKNIWIMGGTEIFKEGMQYADEIFLTVVPFKAYKRYAVSNLVYFPSVDEGKFSVRQCETHPINSRLRIIRYGTDQIRETTDDLRRAYEESSKKVQAGKRKKRKGTPRNRKATPRNNRGEDTLVAVQKETPAN